MVSFDKKGTAHLNTIKRPTEKSFNLNKPILNANRLTIKIVNTKKTQKIKIKLILVCRSVGKRLQINIVRILFSLVSNIHSSIFINFQDVGCAPDILTMNMTHTGELGYVFYIPTEFALHVYDELVEAGKVNKMLIET